MQISLSPAAEMQSAPQKKRSTGLDIVRTYAIFSVLAVHSFMLLGFYDIGGEMSPSASAGYFALIVLRTLFNEAVPLFLLLSGYLQSNKTFGKKHFSGLIPLWITYALSVGAAYLAHVFVYGDTIGFKKLVYSVFSFQINTYSWYFEMFIGLFLLMPFLNLMYKAIPDIRQKAALAAILLFMTSLPSTIAAVPAFGDRLILIPTYWKAFYPVTCYIIGCLLKEVSASFKVRKSILAALLAMSVLGVSAFQFIGSYGKPGFNRYIFGTESDLTTIVIACLMFLILHDIDVKSPLAAKAFKTISVSSFDIYMMSYAADVVVYNAAEAFGIHEVKFFPLTVAVVFAATLILSVVKRFVFDKYRAFYAKLSSPLVKVGAAVLTVGIILALFASVEADGDKALYLAAKDDCTVAEESEQSLLACISPDSPHAVYDENGRVLVGLFHDERAHFTKGAKLVLNDKMRFVFLPAEMKEWFDLEGKYPEDFALRIKQLLGMSPDTDCDSISLMWVYPKDLVRPAADGDISHQPTSYSAFTTSENKELFELSRSQAEADGMLFTKLGYFYDWFDNGRDYGLTAFTLRTGAKVEVKDTYSLGAYREKLSEVDMSEEW